jgi:hypothetical protein
MSVTGALARASIAMDRMLRLPMSFFQGYSAGDLATRVMAITQIQTLASTASVNAILSGIFSFALMFYYDTRLALWAALLISVYCVLSMLLGYLRLRQERPLAELTGKLNNSLLQLILGETKIRLAAGEDRAFARWASLFAQGRRHQLAAERIGAWQAALNQTALPLRPGRTSDPGRCVAGGFPGRVHCPGRGLRIRQIDAAAAVAGFRDAGERRRLLRRPGPGQPRRHRHSPPDGCGDAERRADAGLTVR